MMIRAAVPAHAAGPIEVGDLLDKLVNHSLYRHVRDELTLRTFMETHVFCVWDFQSLLKALQRKLTCVHVPWFPSDDPQARRLINEIVLDEESDEDPQGGYLSHYELYLSAMRDCGADTGPIEGLLAALRAGTPIGDALGDPSIPSGVARFVSHTLAVAGATETHRTAAAFTFGREEVIPAMFRRLVAQLAKDAPQRWSRFLYYLERHIHADSTHHGPLAQALLARLCGDDRRRWQEAEESARAALERRLALWDSVLARLGVTP